MKNSLISTDEIPSVFGGGIGVGFGFGDGGVSGFLKQLLKRKNTNTKPNILITRAFIIIFLVCCVFMVLDLYMIKIGVYTLDIFNP